MRFRAVHRLCHALLSARVISSLSFTVLACSPSGSGRGSWLLQAQSTGCPLCFADASERGVSPRLEVGGSAGFALALTGCWSWIEGQRCSEAAVVLAYEAQVSVSVLACLAALLSQYRWCCCLSRCVGVGQGPRSPPAFCRAGHRAPGGKLHVSLCGCSAFSLRANASL